MSSKNNKNSSTQSSIQAQQNKSKRVRRRYRRRGKSLGPDGILAGYGSSITSVFSSRATSDGQVVKGYDLLPAFQLGNNISFYIPANPTSWNGTRIAALAGGYQSYRPLSFRIHYRPQTGSNSSTAVFIGTLWQTNYITSRDALEPSLLTSPGGVYTPAWQSCVSTVHCGTYLPQRMFPTRDPHLSTVPFAVIVRSTNGGAKDPSVAMAGRLFVEYTYEFRNAIGSGIGFSPSVINSYSLTNGIFTGPSPPVQGVLVDSDREYAVFLPLGATVEWNKLTSPADSYQLIINGSTTAISAVIYVYADSGLP